MTLRTLKRIFEFENISRYAPPSLVLREIAWRYYWRGEAEVRLLRKLVRPGSNSVDVGVAVGNYTYHLARVSSHVYAFEPNPFYVRWLRRCVPRNVTIFDVALSDSAGVATLSIPRIDETTPCREAATIGDNFEAARCERIDVPRHTLDEYGLQNVGFIKIDVEGQEMAVLTGARCTLERCRPVLLIEVIAALSCTDIRAELAAIEELGYRGSFLLHGQLHPIRELEPAKHQPDVAFGERDAEFVANFIFMPDSPRATC